MSSNTNTRNTSNKVSATVKKQAAKKCFEYASKLTIDPHEHLHNEIISEIVLQQPFSRTFLIRKSNQTIEINTYRAESKVQENTLQTFLENGSDIKTQEELAQMNKLGSRLFQYANIMKGDYDTELSFMEINLMDSASHQLILAFKRRSKSVDIVFRWLSIDNVSASASKNSTLVSRDIRKIKSQNHAFF